MAYDIESVGGIAVSPKIKEFVVDSRSDIVNLPTQTTKGISGDGQPFEEECVASGSVAIVSTGEVFKLFPSGWVEL